MTQDTFHISEESMNIINRWTAESGHRRSDVMERAIEAASFMWQLVQDGARIAVVTPDGEQHQLDPNMDEFLSVFVKPG